jgi:hypothetical protein
MATHAARLRRIADLATRPCHRGKKPPPGLSLQAAASAIGEDFRRGCSAEAIGTLPRAYPSHSTIRRTGLLLRPPCPAACGSPIPW